MNSKNFLRRIGGLVLGASLIFGAAIMSSTTVNAQRGGGNFHGGRGFHGGFRTRVFIGPRFGYGYYGYPFGYYSQYVFGDSEAADAQGHEDGLKTGSNDARRGQSDDPERSHYFKDSGFGNFPQDYREGFVRGYEEGFHG